MLQGSGAGIMNISLCFPTTVCLEFYLLVPIGHQGRLHENPVLQITVIFTVETLRNVQIQDFDKSICYD